MGNKIGLVLSGGGIRGVGHVGVLKALSELDIQVHALSGTSAGAIVAAFHSAGFDSDTILEIVKNKKFFGFSNLLFRKAGLFNMESFQMIYNEYFHGGSIEQLKIPLTIVATDIVKGEVVYLDNGPIDVALKASSCVPLVFEPIDFNGTILLDGGILNNFPVEPLVGKCDKIIGVHVNSLSKDLKQIHMKDMLDRSFHFALSSGINEKVKLCDVFIEPPNMSRFGMFDMAGIDEIYHFSYEYTMGMKEQILKAIKD